jgi:hypothetical protein
MFATKTNGDDNTIIDIRQNDHKNFIQILLIQIRFFTTIHDNVHFYLKKYEYNNQLNQSKIFRIIQHQRKKKFE